MVKTAKCFLLIFLGLILLPSCEKEVNKHELALCGSYAVPGMFCYDLKGGSYECTILEQDRYGRIMFQYTANSVITNREETAIIICQAMDAEHVSFYEDICYVILDDSEQDISALKEGNDWNRTLDSTQMSYRKNRISFDLVIQTESLLDYKTVLSAVCENLSIAEKQIRELCILDEDYAGNELYFLRTSNNQDIVFLTNRNFDLAVLEIDGYQSVQAALAKFKAENGWNYGTAQD